MGALQNPSSVGRKPYSQVQSVGEQERGAVVVVLVVLVVVVVVVVLVVVVVVVVVVVLVVVVVVVVVVVLVVVVVVVVVVVISISQLSPVCVSGQVQTYPLEFNEHSPPFSQGLGSQGLISQFTPAKGATQVHM